MVQNHGRAVVKKTTTKISCNEFMSIVDSDVYHCYSDQRQRLTKNKRQNVAYQGIDEGRIYTNFNMLKLRVGAGDGNVTEDQGKVIADTLWNINLNVPASSMKGILMLFENPAAGEEPWARDTEGFYNPIITNMKITIEGVPNQLYSQGMRTNQHWDEVKKLFAASLSCKRHPEVSMVAKDLALAEVTHANLLTRNYGLWLDFRSTDDDQPHGSGRRVENASERTTTQTPRRQRQSGN